MCSACSMCSVWGVKAAHRGEGVAPCHDDEVVRLPQREGAHHAEGGDDVRTWLGLGLGLVRSRTWAARWASWNFPREASWRSHACLGLGLGLGFRLGLRLRFWLRLGLGSILGPGLGFSSPSTCSFRVGEGPGAGGFVSAGCAPPLKLRSGRAPSAGVGVAARGEDQGRPPPVGHAAALALARDGRVR